MSHINLVFVGHVDAGKSSLAGSILLNTGQIEDRMIEKVKKSAIQKGRESWWKAYFLDINEDEQEKGKTVEVARNHFETENNKFTVLDAPGHRAYVPNMIQGASQADVALLVISARKGEFESGFQRDGQTREHVLLCKTFGVSKVIVVVNKMDTCNWDKNRFDEIQKKLEIYLKRTGFKNDSVLWVPISAIEDTGVIEPIKNSWYTGETLIKTLDSLKIDRSKDLQKPLRIPILDTMKETGKNKIIGKIETGTTKLGDILCARNDNYKILHIEDEFGDLTEASAGNNVIITVDGPAEILLPGDILCHSNDSNKPIVTQEFIAQYKITDIPDKRPVFSPGIKAVLHVHTAKTEAECTGISYKINPKTKIKSKVDFGMTGDILIGKFKTDDPIMVEKFENFQQLGRFTLRDEGKTLCIGKITKIKPLK